MAMCGKGMEVHVENGNLEIGMWGNKVFEDSMVECVGVGGPEWNESHGNGKSVGNAHCAMFFQVLRQQWH